MPSHSVMAPGKSVIAARMLFKSLTSLGQEENLGPPTLEVDAFALSPIEADCWWSATEKLCCLQRQTQSLAVTSLYETHSSSYHHVGEQGGAKGILHDIHQKRQHVRLRDSQQMITPSMVSFVTLNKTRSNGIPCDTGPRDVQLYS